MKHLSILAIAATLFAASCNNAPKADRAEVGDARAVSATEGAVYAVNTNESTLGWQGNGVGHHHNGAFNISEGNIKAAAGNLTGGKFVIDMASLKIVDKDTAGTYKLAGHLMSKDFFQADSFKTSVFEITSVKAGTDTAGNKELVMKDATHTITGNLTMHGVTKSVIFPAKVAMADNAITTDASFNIDRNDWGIVYNNNKSVGDHFIEPIVNITLHIVAAK